MMLPAFSPYRRIIVILFLFFSPVLSWAQQYGFLRYTIDNGLPQSRVNSIFQDNDGFIWMSTEAGIARFDGTHFHTYQNQPGLFLTPAKAITEYEDALLFASDSGISCFYGNRFTPYRFPASPGVSRMNALGYGANGELLVATDRGIFSYSKGKFTQALQDASSLDVRVITLDSQKRLWLGTQGQGVKVFRWNAGKYTEEKTPCVDPLSKMNIRAIIEKESDELWIGVSGSGIYSCNGTSLSEVELPKGDYLRYITCGHKDKLGNLWFGTWGGGVMKYTQSVFKVYNNANGLGSDVVLSIASESTGNVWIGTFSSGASLYMGEQFITFSAADGLPDERVNSIVCDSVGNIWMSTVNGLARYDGVDMNVFTTKDGLSTNRIGALAVDPEGRILAGLFDGSFAVVDDGKITCYPNTDSVSYEILSITNASDGGAWVGTVRHGLMRWQNNKLELAEGGDFFNSYVIWSVIEDHAGRLWVGTERGVFCYQDGKVKSLVAKNRRGPDVAVYALQYDQQYLFFASSGKGIWRYEFSTDKLQFLNTTEGLSSNNVLSMCWLNKGSLMAATSEGIDKIDFHNGFDNYRHFRREDGLGAREYSPSAMCVDKNGCVWIGSTTGVIQYNPAGAAYRSAPPRIVLRNISLPSDSADWKLFTDSINPRTALPVHPRLTSDHNDIRFDFSGIQFGSGVNLRYQYMLEGYDKGWSPVTTSDNVSYRHLPPGQYRFLVRAGNSLLQWSQPAEFRFEVLPPFYATSWFFLILLVLISVFIGMMAYLLRRQRYVFIRMASNQQSLAMQRMILVFAGILYPVTGSLIHFFLPAIKVQNGIQVALGIMLVATAALSLRNRFISARLYQVVLLMYCVIVLHLVYINYLNLLEPVCLVALVVTLGGVSIIFTRLRDLLYFAIGLLLVSGLAAFSLNRYAYHPWLFVVAEVSALLVGLLGVVVRDNIFKRLIFSDSVITKSRNLIIAADNQGNIVFANNTFQRLLGYAQDEILGDGWWKIRTDNNDENERIRKQILNTEAASPSSSYVTPIRSKWGKTLWIQWVDTVLENGMHVGVGQDITDRHEMEERYRHIVDAAIDIIYLCDFRGNFTFVNDVATKLTGYTQEELLGRPFTDFVLPEYVEEVTHFYEKQFSRRTLSTYFEIPIYSKSGQVIWLAQTVRALQDDENPRYIKGFQAIARDITERKGYEEELEKLSLVASETINGVLICDGDNLVEWLNDGFTRLTGYSSKELKGKRAGDVMAGPDTNLDSIIEARKRMAVGESFHIEAKFYKKSGEPIWLQVSSTPIVDERGRLLRQIEIFTDVTERKHYEKQLSEYSKRLEILNAVKRDILATRSVEEIARVVLSNLSRHLPHCSGLSLCIFEHQQGTANCYISQGGSKAPLVQQIRMAEMRSMPFLLKNQYVLVHDLEAETQRSLSDEENLARGVRSYLVMPLFVQDGLIGSILMDAREANTITAIDVELVRDVADSMANAVQQRRYQELLLQKNKDISDSINYALRIQEALLPPREVLHAHFSDSFVMYHPKDVLSGDFYWIENTDDLTWVAVADGTGHGVPGALMSLMGQNLLGQALLEKNLRSPGEILDYMSREIQRSLNQYKNVGEMRDGIDIGLISIDRRNMKLRFSGAVNPLWLQREGRITEVKGDRFSLGTWFENTYHFGTFEASIQPGDCIYLFSDGLADQFGGDNDKKFSYARFREILTTHASEPMSVQCEQIENAFRTWKGVTVQTDDVCVLGLRID